MAKLFVVLAILAVAVTTGKFFFKDISLSCLIVSKYFNFEVQKYNNTNTSSMEDFRIITITYFRQINMSYWVGRCGFKIIRIIRELIESY